jgi:ATP-dependent Clp protease ATP-binding subunit ClpB
MCRPLKDLGRRRWSALPKVEGHGGEVQIGRDLTNLLNLTDKEAQKRGDQFIASEMFLLAAGRRQGRNRPPAEAARPADRKALEAAIEAVRGGQGVGIAGSRRPARGAEEILRRPDRTRRARASSTR